MPPEAIAEHPDARTIAQELPEAITGLTMAADGVVLAIAPEQLVPVCRILKSAGRYQRLSAVTGVDWWPGRPRFEVVYFLHSPERNVRLRLTVKVDEEQEVDSVCPVWRGANWYEREVFDLFGVRFRNHPNLERIMLPADWEGHPLRKDYPVHGHKYSYQEE